jgi:hypothetical protein
VDTIDYNNEAQPLILEQLKRQYGPDNVITGGGQSGGQSAVAIVTFPRYSFASNVVPFSITDTADLIVVWGLNQENKGTLIYGIDYTVVGNCVVLNNGAGGGTDWTPTVAANALGLLNITVTQEN